ncbi:mechanosensitive ion channel family protein [Puniceicoccales bacterium CK1056]|uniref:Mechanosensitive ion channel family protein n=1 Tax=Oceanipulchritudo coccoides TaxID=2706888 RepID=A0A6B2M076_9BACT|nr:mechanosensitive ion channel family protein [Oceanipulchritudo coccoides]NDV61802.1 mechanosensitive ion channel family protein [Oceanipulchritudo coccoides]
MDTTNIEQVIQLYGLRVIGAIITLVIGYLVAGWIKRWIKRLALKSGRIDDTVGALFAQIAFVAVILFTITATLNQFGVATTSIVAALGAAGLAIGLALQGTLSNVAAGVMILILKPFKNGEAVKVSGSVYLIDEIGLMATRAHEPDGPKAFIPNSKLWGDILINFSQTHNDLRRFNETFGISYADDIGKAIETVKQVLADEEKVLDDPASMVEVVKLNESSVDLIVQAWIPRADWWSTKLRLTRQIKEAFDKAGVVIPFPQRDVHLFQKNES